MEKSQVIETEKEISEDKTSEAGDIGSRNGGKDESKEDLESESETESIEGWNEETEGAEDSKKKKRLYSKLFKEYEQRREREERIEISNRSEIIKMLLERRGGRHVEIKTLIEASKLVLGGADIMALLLRQNGTRPIPEDVVEAVAKKWENSKMMEVLVDHQSDIPITESVLIAAASGQPYPDHRIVTNGKWKTVLEILLRHRPGIQISENVVRAATANDGGGRDSLIEALFTYRKDVPITEGIVIEAAKQRLDDPDLSRSISRDHIREKMHDGSTDTTQELELENENPACPTCWDLQFSMSGFGKDFFFNDLILTMETSCRYCLLIGKCIDRFNGGIKYALYPDVCVQLRGRSDIRPLQIYLGGVTDFPSGCPPRVELYTHADTPQFAGAIGVRRSVCGYLQYHKRAANLF